MSDGHGGGIAQFAVDNGDEQTVEIALSILVIGMVVFFIDGFYFVLLHKSTSVETNELTDEVTKVYSVSISNINRMLLSGVQITFALSCMYKIRYTK